MEETLIIYRDVELCRGENLILRNVTFEQRKGEYIYITGRVGSGKSTLLKTLYCDMPVNRGEASVLNYNLLKIKTNQIPLLRRKLGIVFQDFQLLTDRSVYHNLEFVLKATGWKDKSETEDRIQSVLTQVGMANKGYKKPYELSGGEQQRIAIARALLNYPQIILADEPTGNLDVESGRRIVQLLHDISDNGTAVIMTTHNYQWVKEFPAKIKNCENGELIDSDGDY
jgi:cell division transport system ATP-binding protein